MLMQLNNSMNLNRHLKQKQRGIGLLELMLSLSIIAILLVMATRYYMSAKQSQQVGDTVSMVSGIVSGGANYATQNNGVYTGISLDTLVKGGYVPASFCGSNDGTSCPGINPWRGTTVVGSAAAGNYTIVMNQVPDQICPNIANMVNASLKNTQVGGNTSQAVCNATTLTVTVY